MPTEIITREEALEKGLKRYFDGKPCRRGHIAERVLLGKSKYGACVECKKITQSDWRDNNREKHNSWGKNNPGKRAESQDRYLKNHPGRRKKTALDWIDRNREAFREYQRELRKRLREDPAWVFRKNLRDRLGKALRRVSAAKSASTLELIGCTADELWLHLEAQFTEGMTRENYGNGRDKWNVDHKIPCAAFDLTDPAQQRACFHYSNLQPMWQPDNARKGAKIL